MHKSTTVSVVLHVLFGAAALLWKGSRSRDAQANAKLTPFDLLPLKNQEPVVLVCGEGLDDLFQKQRFRETAQGYWLRVDHISALSDVVRSMQQQQPRQTGQLSVMYVCLPDQHQDEVVLRASVKALRQQIKQLSRLTGFTLPVVINCKFSGPKTPWIIFRDDKPFAFPVDETPVALNDWLLREGNFSSLPILSQAFIFVHEKLLDELEKADGLYPAVHPFAITLRTGTVSAEDQSLWSLWLYRRTYLQLPQISGCYGSTNHFPDVMLLLLAPFAVRIQGGQHTRCVILLLWLCILVALGFSANNNRDLICQIGADLQRWYAIPMTHYDPKAQSLRSLKEDVLLLERWQRQGEPVKYSLGYYPRQRLWLALQQAIDTYLPPPHFSMPVEKKLMPVEKNPKKTVHLDALSLFDIGQYQLKPNSKKMLVNALIGIKAKPGWLIVVAGHTDITGDVDVNQMLSLKRAEALRDWMLSTSNLSPTCFTVQGYGATRPVATNDTAEGRTANRRVEISLVPQANACQAAAPQPASGPDAGITTNQEN